MLRARQATPPAPEAARSTGRRMGSLTPIRPKTSRPSHAGMVYSGPFTSVHAERLLWRAGFGPRPGEADALAEKGLEAAVLGLTRPSGAARLTGPAPTDRHGDPIAPADVFGHDHLYWLDRMVRSNQPLVERMALIWHDWFATSGAKVDPQQRMLDQAELFRRNALGSFLDLALKVTADPAMLLWLDGSSNHKGRPNENYARELMELFTLGADRGAYTETDVRELARALTGFDDDFVAGRGHVNFRYEPKLHDDTNKTIFGRTGNFSATDAVTACIAHPLHVSFFVAKLWSYFVPTSPSAATQRHLEGIYVSTGRGIRPVVEAILMHPDLLQGLRMVKPPVVWGAGLLRAIGRGVDHDYWWQYAEESGQRLFRPPDVSGWDDTRWLDTSTLLGRWLLARETAGPRSLSATSTTYPATETPAEAVTAALDFWGQPAITSELRFELTRWASRCLPAVMTKTQRSAFRAQRQNALRLLIANSPDFQTS